MTDERYKKIMADLGMPDSRSLLGALKQVANEVAQEYAADNSRLLTALADTEALELGTSERCAKLMEELAAAHLVIEQMREALLKCRAHIGDPANFDCYGSDKELVEFFKQAKRNEGLVIKCADEAIALHQSTEALVERDRKRDAALLRGLALDFETKRDVAVSTLEKVKADRQVAKKALAAQCDETKKLRALLATAKTAGVTLTGKEIRELAEFAGLQIVEHNYADEYETEITIETPSGFLVNDDGEEEYYRLIAYFTEEPEEGAIGLGDAIEKGGV